MVSPGSIENDHAADGTGYLAASSLGQGGGSGLAVERAFGGDLDLDQLVGRETFCHLAHERFREPSLPHEDDWFERMCETAKIAPLFAGERHMIVLSRLENLGQRLASG